MLLTPIGRTDKAIEAGELEQETHQANATRPDFGTHQVGPDNEAMQEGQPGRTLKKGPDSGILVEAVLIGLPRLQSGSGNLKLLSRLTLGHALGSQLMVLREEICTFEPIPACLVIIVALWLGLHYGFHSDLLCSSLAF